MKIVSIDKTDSRYYVPTSLSEVNEFIDNALYPYYMDEKANRLPVAINLTMYIISHNLKLCTKQVFILEDNNKETIYIDKDFMGYLTSDNFQEYFKPILEAMLND